MPLSKKSQEIVDYVLSLTPEQYDKFIAKLNEDQANYLDVILEKLERENQENE